MAGWSPLFFNKILMKNRVKLNFQKFFRKFFLDKEQM